MLNEKFTHARQWMRTTAETIPSLRRRAS
jgi:hypothetical protein